MSFITLFAWISGRQISLPFDLSFEVYSEILNLVVLAIFVFYLRWVRWYSADDAGVLTDRVNALIRQMYFAVLWFILFLIGFFLVNILRDLKSNVLILPNSSFPLMTFLEVSCNAFSATFIFLCFRILYYPTLTDDNKNDIYYKLTVGFAVALVVFYFVLLTKAGNDQKDLDKISNYFKAFVGLYNGMAMNLLFGRLVSVNLFLREKKMYAKSWHNIINNLGVTVLLPLYALLQVMYATLELADFKLHGDPLKATVFCLCSVCKFYFLLFVSSCIRRNFMHIYLSNVLKRSVTGKQLEPESIIGVAGPCIEQGWMDPNVTYMEIYCTYECKEWIRRENKVRNLNGNFYSGHEHGGNCVARIWILDGKVVRFNLEGNRTWTKEIRRKRTEHTFMPWTSKHESIEDSEYNYVYNITTPGDGPLDGYNTGKIELTDDKKNLLAFKGNYTQHTAKGIAYGTKIVQPVTPTDQTERKPSNKKKGAPIRGGRG